MVLKKYFSGICIILLISCISNDKSSFQNADTISKSIEKATTNTISFEGEFLRIEKISGNEYYVYLKDSTGSTIPFVTIMPISASEIKALKKDTINIRLQYQLFNNPVRKKTEKLIKFFQPIYGLR